jgi:hypothetical protein
MRRTFGPLKLSEIYNIDNNGQLIFVSRVFTLRAIFEKMNYALDREIILLTFYTQVTKPAGSSEMPVPIYQTPQRHISENGNFTVTAVGARNVHNPVRITGRLAEARRNVSGSVPRLRSIRNYLWLHEHPVFFSHHHHHHPPPPPSLETGVTTRYIG